ncbi:MAG: hypothetical protein ACRD2X_24875 [Vicinamibacteraceae bacterium]
MTQTSEFTISIVPIDGDHGRLADAELVFTSGPVTGLKVVGFTVWPNPRGRGENA